MRIFTAACLALVATSAAAHHGSNGQFDTTKEISVSGVVTKIRFVNPHSYVYFDAANADGSTDPWRCELRAGSLLKRNGWTTDMFAAGTEISIEGSPARREEFGCLTQTITFADGSLVSRYDSFEDGAAAAPVETSVKLAEGTPNINGNWVAPPRNPGGGAPGGAGGAGRPAGGNTAGGVGADGRPAGPPRGGAQYSQTDAGKAASAGFEREDNPRYHCQATNIFHDWTFDQHVNKIEQTDDKIVLSYGFMDIVRTIHLDMDAHPKDIDLSRAGHSIGSWDGDTLVVDTIGFTSGYLEATRSGVKHSDHMHVVERFSLSEDGQSLNSTYKIEDALYLSAPREGQASIGRTTDEFDPYECEDLTEEVVEGF